MLVPPDILSLDTSHHVSHASLFIQSMEEEADVQGFQELISGVAEPISFVGALLVAASVTVLARLSAGNDSHPLTNYIIGTFLFSTCTFLVLVVHASALQMVPVLLKFAEGEESVDFDFSMGVIEWTMSIGILSFLLGLGQLGWLKSRNLGLFSTLVAVVASIFIISEFL